MHVFVGGISGTTCSLNDEDIREMVGKGDKAKSNFIIFRGVPTISFVSTLSNGLSMVVITDSGQVAKWGSNIYGDGYGSGLAVVHPKVPESRGSFANKTILSISQGYRHTLVVCADGSLHAYGYNDWGDISNNNTEDNYGSPAYYTPIDITHRLSGKEAAQACAGQYYSSVLCTDGTLFAWGDGQFGKIGNNTANNSDSPVAINSFGSLNGKTVSSLPSRISEYRSYCITSDGVVHGWGRASGYAFGNGDASTNQLVPITISGGSLATKVAVALHTTLSAACVHCSDSSVHLWGTIDGQVIQYPIEISGSGSLAGKLVTQVATGGQHVVLLAQDGTVHVYGRQPSGSVTTPTEVSTGTISGRTAVKVAAGFSYGQESTYVLCSDNTLHVWGFSLLKQYLTEFHSDQTTDILDPISISSLPGLYGRIIQDISAGLGEYHVMAIDDTGEMIVWGWNQWGHLGYTSSPFSHIPRDIGNSGSLMNKTVVGLSEASYDPKHTFFIASDNTLHAIGDNMYFQLGDGTSIPRYAPVQCDLGPVLSTKTISKVYAIGLYGMSAIVTTDGQLWTWGYRTARLGWTPSTAHGEQPTLVQGSLVGKSVVRLSFSFVQNSGPVFALTSDGGWHGWGSSLYYVSLNGGSAEPGAVSLTGSLVGKSISDIQCGNGYTIILCTDNSVHSVGLGWYGHLGTGLTSSETSPVEITNNGSLNTRTVVMIRTGEVATYFLCSDNTIHGCGRDSVTNQQYQVITQFDWVIEGKIVESMFLNYFCIFLLYTDGTLSGVGVNWAFWAYPSGHLLKDGPSSLTPSNSLYFTTPQALKLRVFH